jgi:alkanesulfonate monooxygenase SsuD/methylene tetrahydromethanopterin reductase-like flavin-dependent oxidoreductase (luciferase family)
VGRSGLPAHDQGFNIPYAESRDRFLETLNILVKAWTQERFTHEGKYFQFRNGCLVPKPLQRPHRRSASPPPPRTPTRWWAAGAIRFSWPCARRRSPN